MIPMPIEYSQCQQNALHDSNISRTTQMCHTSFIEYIVYLRFESWRPLNHGVRYLRFESTIMASVATKRRVENKSYKIKYQALKELEKGTPHKDVVSLFEVPKNTLSTWKKNSLYSKFEEAMMRSLRELNFNVEKEYVFNKKQTLISDFFLKH